MGRQVSTSPETWLDKFYSNKIIPTRRNKERDVTNSEENKAKFEQSVTIMTNREENKEQTELSVTTVTSMTNSEENKASAVFMNPNVIEEESAEFFVLPYLPQSDLNTKNLFSWEKVN